MSSLKRPRSQERRFHLTAGASPEVVLRMVPVHTAVAPYRVVLSGMVGDLPERTLSGGSPASGGATGNAESVWLGPSMRYLAGPPDGTRSPSETRAGPEPRDVLHALRPIETKMPSLPALLELAQRCRPPQSWYDEEEKPF